MQNKTYNIESRNVKLLAHIEAFQEPHSRRPKSMLLVPMLFCFPQGPKQTQPPILEHGIWLQMLE